MTYRLRNISIAIALAVVAALLTSYYVSNYQRNVRADETNVAIWVAARDIPAGTPGASAVQKGFLTKTEVVRRNVVPGAISNPAQLAGLISVEKVLAGEQVTSRRFVAPSERGIQAQLKGTQRAISIPGDKDQLLAGTLQNGDRVDLVATFAAPESGQNSFTRVVLRDLEVLRAPASNAAAAEKLASTDGAHSVMLKVTDTQAPKLHWVFASAKKWHLELRPATDAADSPENVESWYSVLREGVRANQLDEAGVSLIDETGGGN